MAWLAQGVYAERGTGILTWLIIMAHNFMLIVLNDPAIICHTCLHHLQSISLSCTYVQVVMRNTTCGRMQAGLAQFSLHSGWLVFMSLHPSRQIRVDFTVKIKRLISLQPCWLA